MKFKIPFNLLGVLCLVVLFAGFVNGYWVDIDFQDFNNGNSRIWGINCAHVITKDGDLESKIWVTIFLDDWNVSDNHSGAKIYFYPSESDTNEPIKDISIAICDGMGSHNLRYDIGISGECNISYDYNVSTYNTASRYFVHDGRAELRNYTRYVINFMPEGNSVLLFLINYTTPNFVSKQGDYYVAWLSLQNVGDSDTNSIVLPSEYDIPRFLPDAKEIQRLPYIEDGKIHYRWVFLFRGSGEKIIWYQNIKEIEENERTLQRNYTVLGAIIGFVLAIVILFLERFLFDWSPYGNRMLRWFMKKFRRKYVIGNTNNRIYHKTDCVFVDNIKNKKTFNNKDSAEKEGYKPCEICNSDD